MLHIAERWRETKKEFLWQIAYRPKINGTILTDRETPFELLVLPKGTWGADPFLFEIDGKMYLFYELFLTEKKKGVIAVSLWDGKGFSVPQIVIEEEFHLSFPSIFVIGESIYMIPETGSQNQLILYQCMDDPFHWKKVKTLLEVPLPSDTIVFQQEDQFYVLTSILKESASSAQNYLYRLNPQQMTVELCSKQEGFGEGGYRNAGLFFEDQNRLIRPGQNCPNGSYGKSLYFWEYEKTAPTDYRESFLAEITVEDIHVAGQHDGVHTYNCMGGFDVIDLRHTHYFTLIQRLSTFCEYCLRYIRQRI